MRGRLRDQAGLFSYISPEARVPPRHPLRQIREFVRTVLKELSISFGKLYSSEGRALGRRSRFSEGRRSWTARSCSGFTTR